MPARQSTAQASRLFLNEVRGKRYKSNGRENQTVGQHNRIHPQADGKYEQILRHVFNSVKKIKKQAGSEQGK
jgi:hypothetical protein